MKRLPGHVISGHSRRPVYFKQNLEPKEMRGRRMATRVQAPGDVWNEIKEELSKAHEKRVHRTAVAAVYTALVFPFALWIMLGLGVVHSHFGVVPALGYWETTLVVLGLTSAAQVVNAGRKDG